MNRDSLQHIKSVERTDNLTIIKLTGSITFQNLSEVQKEFAQVTKDIEVKNILFDLKDVSNTDSSAVAGFIDLLRYMKSHQVKGKVGVVHLSDSMRSHLSVLKVDAFFNQYPSHEAAVKDLSKA